MSNTSSNPFNSIVKQAYTTMPILPPGKLNPGKAEFPKSAHLMTGLVVRPGLLTSSQLFSFTLAWDISFFKKTENCAQ